MAAILTGIDRVVRDGVRLPGKGRAGLLCNASSATSSWTPTPEALPAAGGLQLVRIFSPQHGFAAEKQDNMVASRDGVHPRLGIPMVSLYGERREPPPEAFDGLDAVIVDLVDVGTRVYTFLITALLLIRAAAARGVPVVVLDRPNPIGGAAEGPCLEKAFRSFVGLVDVPLRHGLTAGEYCLYGAWRMDVMSREDAVRAADEARRTGGGGAERPVSVIALEGWRRSLHHGETGLPWISPSPNMPTPETALVYPGQVLLEGTNLSEGRGTTRPFELFGAPYIEPAAVLAALASAGCLEKDGSGRGRAGSVLAGVLLREVAFEPTFHKYAGELVRGFQLHVLDREAYRPVAATTALLWAARRAAGEAFAWREPPYEYEPDRKPIDLLYGTDRIRLRLEGGASPEEIAREWDAEVAAYDQRARDLSIYT
jgi:uncharacterized protein YbbC (DUF1343 family)